MIIQAFPSGPFETNAYVIACPQTKQAIIVDPSPDSAPLLSSYLAEHQLTPTAIWLTHSHWDHIADVVPVKAQYGIPVYVHALDAPNLENPGIDNIPFWVDIEGIKADHFLKEGDKMKVGNIVFTVIETPGHSPGGVCFSCTEEQILISGDTIFKGSIGNLSLPTGNPTLMWPSLEKLAKLPSTTRVFPGHGPSTTIGNEDWLPRAKFIFGNL